MFRVENYANVWWVLSWLFQTIVVFLHDNELNTRLSCTVQSQNTVLQSAVCWRKICYNLNCIFSTVNDADALVTTTKSLEIFFVMTMFTYSVLSLFGLVRHAWWVHQEKVSRFSDRQICSWTYKDISLFSPLILTMFDIQRLWPLPYQLTVWHVSPEEGAQKFGSPCWLSRNPYSGEILEENIPRDYLTIISVSKATVVITSRIHQRKVAYSLLRDVEKLETTVYMC